jgi:hypothetical protein
VLDFIRSEVVRESFQTIDCTEVLVFGSGGSAEDSTLNL